MRGLSQDGQRTKPAGARRDLGRCLGRRENGEQRAERGGKRRAGPHLAQRGPITALMATRPRRAGATAPPAPGRLRGAAPAPTLTPGPAPGGERRRARPQAGIDTGSRPAMAEPLRPFRLRGCGSPQKFGVAAGSLRGLLRKGCRLLQVRMVRDGRAAAGCWDAHYRCGTDLPRLDGTGTSEAAR